MYKYYQSVVWLIIGVTRYNRQRDNRVTDFYKSISSPTGEKESGVGNKASQTLGLRISEKAVGPAAFLAVMRVYSPVSDQVMCDKTSGQWATMTAWFRESIERISMCSMNHS